MRKYILLLLLSTPFYTIGQVSDISNQTVTKIQTLGHPINTLDFAEFSPTLSADGNTMIFESDRAGKGIWRLYISTKNKQGAWSDPKPFEVVNNFVGPGDFLGGACLSYDGNTLFFTSDKKGTVGGIDIWYTLKVGGKWAVPKNAGKGINTGGYDGFPSISENGKYLYFMREGTKNTSTGERCCSLYVAERRGAFYMNAKLLPAPINTGCEGYPRMMADNKTLIFSSDRPNGKGGYDLYESKIRAGKWTTPVPLTFLNTHRDDELISVPSSGDYIYFSNTSSNSRDDIYRVELPDEFRPDKIISLEGTIRDQETNKVIPATIKVNNINTKEKVMEIKNNEVTGKYTVLLQEGEKYDISISSKGKTFQSEVLDLEKVKKYQTVKKDIALKPLKTNTSFVLNNIFFDFNAATINKDSELELERVVEMIVANPTMNVEISAHTDDKGTDAYNEKLSQARAESVVDFLLKKGIAKERLTAKGYGKAQPAFPNDTDENRAKNRRVEFKVVKI